MSAIKHRLEIAALIAEVTAALGVIISVLYLATEVSGNTNALRAQSHHDLLTQFNETVLIVAKDPELAKLVHTGNTTPSQLTTVEWARYSSLTHVALNSWEYGYYLNLDGSVPPSLWEGGNAYWLDLAMTQPGVKKVWDEVGHAFAEPFYSFADEFFKVPIPAPQTSNGE